MNDRDPFVLLGVPRDADDATIKRAYRRLARDNHPDHNPDDGAAMARFQEISWAYQQIGRAEDRARFQADRAGAASSLGGDFADLFSEGGPLGRRGADIRVQLTLSFLHAYEGADVEVVATSQVLCTTCGGSGAAPGTHARQCPVCRGLAMHRAGRLTTPCAACNGTGRQIDSPCPDCDGGQRLVRRPHRITVPAGIRDGETLRLPGAGEEGADQPGDLVAEVHVTASALFEWLPESDDLLVTVPVSYAEAALGAHVRIPTPGRPIVVHLPAGSSSGTLLRVREHGWPRRDESQHGDLYARIVVMVPETLTAAQRRLVTQLRGHDDRGIRDGIFAARERDDQRSG